MKELEMKDDLLTPQKFITIQGNTTNPVRFADTTADILKAKLEISSAKIWNMKLVWDSLGGSFKAQIQGNKGFDNWTTLAVFIEISGSQDLKTKEGNIVVAIYPTITTKYEYSNPLQVMLWNIYANMFYIKRRMDYMKQSKNLVDKIKQEYISLLELQPKA